METAVIHIHVATVALLNLQRPEGLAESLNQTRCIKYNVRYEATLELLGAYSHAYSTVLVDIYYLLYTY